MAGALWIIGGKLGSSLIFYFVAIDPRSTKNASRNLYSSGAQSAPAQRVINVYMKPGRKITQTNIKSFRLLGRDD